MRQPTIRWKYKQALNIWEGFVGKDLFFCIEGTLCLSDLRDTSYSMSDYRPSKVYSISSIVQAKEIAYDLLNKLNIEIHESNRNRLLAKEVQSRKIMEEADQLIKKYSKP